VKHTAEILLSLLLIISMLLPTPLPAMDREVARERIQYLSSEISRHDYLYYVLGKPEISDLAYDRLFDELLRLEQKFPDLVLPDSPAKRVGSQLDNSFSHVRHIIPMLSLEKCYSHEQLVLWAEKTRKKAGRELSFVAEEKIDGTAIELVYWKGILTRASTRGNGEKGFDVTNNARTIRSIPLKLGKAISITVRGEVFIRKSDFQKIGKDRTFSYHSLRNSAAGALRKKHSSETAKIPLDMFVFEAVSGEPDEIMKHSDMLVFLNKLGFKTNSATRTFSDYRKLTSHIDELLSLREELDYEIDGVVVKVNERRVRELLGATERFPKWAIAYKFESPEHPGIVENIMVSIGRTGRLTPVATFRAVRFGNAEISSATLHNQNYINTLELALGDTVKIARKGGVIPAVVLVTEKNTLGNDTWQMPRYCPVCKNAIKAEGHHFCLNTDCPGRLRAGLIWFSKKMGIRYLGPKTIDKLISQKKIQYPEDIYTLNAEDLEDIGGFGEKKISALMSSIEESKSKPFQVVLSALGAEGLGTRNIRLLADAGLNSVDKILNAGVSGLVQVKGIGEVTARKIIDGLNPRIIKNVKTLKAQGLNL